MSRELIFHGVDWTSGSPLLHFSSLDDQPRTMFLEPRGASFQFHCVGGERGCLGFYDFDVAGDSHWIPCSERRTVTAGLQCERCKSLDPFHQLHTVHHGAAQLPQGLAQYVAQPHWLYIATFADGVSKVGTAANVRKYARLGEQGALLATFVCLAEDGRIVRHLEDAVSSELGLTQGRAKSSKLRALLRSVSGDSVRQSHSQTVARTRSALDSWARVGDKWRVQSESWESPFLSLIGSRCELYPQSISEGSHGLNVLGVWGSAILCEVLGGEEAGPFLVELSGLRGSRLLLGDYYSSLEAMQLSLF